MPLPSVVSGSLGAAESVDRVEVLVADETDVPPAFGDMRVDFGGRRVGQPPDGAVATSAR